MPPRQMVVKMCGSYGGTAVKTMLHDSEVDALFSLLHGTVEIDPCDGCGLVGADECGVDCLYPRPVRNAWIDARHKLLDLAHIADGTDKPSPTTKPDYPEGIGTPTKALEHIAGFVEKVWEMDGYETVGGETGCVSGGELVDRLAVLSELLPIVARHLKAVEQAFRVTHNYPPVLGIPME